MRIEGIHRGTALYKNEYRTAGIYKGYKININEIYEKQQTTRKDIFCI